MHRFALALILLLPAVAAAPAQADDEAKAPQAPKSERVTFETKDGFTLVADYTPAKQKGAPAVVLLHQFTSNRSAWKPLVPALHEAGLAVLAVDQRAHGESTKQGDKQHKVMEIGRNFAPYVQQGPEDVGAALAFLAQQGCAKDRVALVGASYGCTVSLLSARKFSSVWQLVLLSPGTSYFGVDVTAHAREFRGAIRTYTAEDDRRGTNTAMSRELAKDPAPQEIARPGNVGCRPGARPVTVFEKGGHGTNLLTSHPEIVREIAQELAAALKSKQKGK